MSNAVNMRASHDALKTELFSRSFPDLLYQRWFSSFMTQFTTLTSLDYKVVMTFRFNLYIKVSILPV